MKKILLCKLLLFSCVYLHATNLKIDWEAFMAKKDLIWDILPEQWYESAFMGNGRLGLMIYKEPGRNAIRFETGNSEVHDHRRPYGLFGNPRLLTGHFLLVPRGTIIKGNMRLHLWNAETTTEIHTTEGLIRLRAFVHAEDSIIVIQTKTEGNEKDFGLEWVSADPQSPRYLYANTKNGNWIKVPEYKLNPQPQITQTAYTGYSIQKLSAGGATAVAWKETIDKSGYGRTLFCTITHSYPDTTATERCKKIIKKAFKKNYGSLFRSHSLWWNRFYPKSFISLPDGIKENFYWIQLYKLASATRGNRDLIDNCGPWLTVTPWPNAWWNLNVQLTYWALNASNHTDLAKSLENAIYNHIENLRQNVPQNYQENALALGRSSNLECQSEPVGIPGANETAEIGLLTWACHNLWLIYRHTMDEQTLQQKLFPVLKGAINYYLHFLKEEKDGFLHLPRTYSPEYGNAEDCNFDLALLRWGCQTLLRICHHTNTHDPLMSKWEDVLKRLTPYPKDHNGLMIGRDTPYMTSHRHYSHLLAIYPLYLINRETPEDSTLIETSLSHWQSKPAALRGYSFTGAASIAAALGKGNEALSYLNRLFDTYLSVNTLYRESGPVIETPLSGAQVIHELLLQSWGEKIRIFPAIPDSWKDVSFYHLLTEGALEVSASRRNGITTFIEIKSLAGEPCTIVTDMENPVFEGVKRSEVKQTAPDTYHIELKKGRTVSLYPRGNKNNTISPVINKGENHFGKKHPSNKQTKSQPLHLNY